MTPEQVYSEWRKTLKKPDDSIFYYHASLDRIILALSMYAIASRPYLSGLKKAETITFYNECIDSTVTAWIDGDGEAFSHNFSFLMTMCQAYFPATMAYENVHKGRRKAMRDLRSTFIYWVGAGGDIDEDKAQELLDTVTTDGERIESERISAIARRIQPTIIREGVDFGLRGGYRLLEEA